MSDNLDAFFSAPTGKPAAAPAPDATGLGAFFGSASAPVAPTPVAPTRAPRSESDIALGGAKAATKEVARWSADFGDTLLSAPGMAMGLAADVASRVQSIAEGVEPRAAGRIAKEVRQGIASDYSPTPLRQLTELAIQAVSPDKKEKNETDVTRAMQLIAGGIERGGHWFEEKTGIPAETFDSLVNTGMAAGGVKGMVWGAKQLGPRDPKAPTGVPPYGRVTNFLNRDVFPQKKRPAAAPIESVVEVTPPWRPQPQAGGSFSRMPDGTLVPTAQVVRRSAGVRDPAQAELAARRKEARDAFKRDPAVADRMEAFAAEEARLRSFEDPLTAPGGQAGSGPRTPRTGSRAAFEEPALAPGATRPIETGAPPMLDSALAKLRAGKGFDMTAAEKIALRDVSSSFGKPAIEVPKGQRGATTLDMNKLVATLGIGTGMAAWAYLNEDRDTTIAAALGAIAAGGGARSALGVELGKSGYTLKTLERLPQNHTEFTRAQVEQQLARPDVSKAEKDLVTKVLGDKEKISSVDLVKAFGEATRTQELRPKEVPDYSDYGLDSIGREADTASDWQGSTPEYQAAHQAVSARTTLYESPLETSANNHFDAPNYFAHTRSFDEGGVRHVMEIQSDLAQNAKVVPEEIRVKMVERLEKHNKFAAALDRADMAFGNPRSTVLDSVNALNKLEKAVDPDILFDFKLIMGNYLRNIMSNQRGSRNAYARDLAEQFQRHSDQGNTELIYIDAKKYFEVAAKQDYKGGSGEYLEILSNAFQQAFDAYTRKIDQMAGELTAKLGSIVPKEIEPMMKNWPKRVIREEIAATQRARGATPHEVQILRERIAHLQDLETRGGYGKEGHTLESLRHQIGQDETRIRVLEDRLKMASGPVRFATADTVAKVEGWREESTTANAKHQGLMDVWERDYQMQAPRILREHEGNLRRNAESVEDLDKIPRQMATAEANMKSAKKYQRLFENPDHAGLYLRYADDINPWIERELKAKPYTDAKGHTWLEVPPQKRGPTQMYGRASTRDMATLAAVSGAALTADWLQDDPSIGVDAMAGLLAGLATRAPARTTVGVGLGAATAAYLSSEENRTRNTAATAAFLGVAGFMRSRNKEVARWADATTQGAETFIGNISSSLKEMSPPLLRRFTNHEKDLKIREHRAMNSIAPLSTGLLDLPVVSRQAVDAALFNGDRATALKLVAGRPELVKGMKQAFDYIDKTGKELTELGLLKRAHVDHFPRIVTDLDGLMTFFGKEGGDLLGRKLYEAQQESITRTKQALSDVEISRIVNEHLESAVRREDLGGQSGILKKRTIREVTQDLLSFYASAADSIALYARSASREIERARFFGKDLVKSRETNGVNVADSVGALVTREGQAGKLSKAQLKQLEDITKARFGPGERSPHWLSQSYKNAISAMLLGNPLSAMVQMGDAGIAIAVHGLVPTIKAAVETSVGRSKWKLNEFGLINHLSEDMILGAKNPLNIGKYEVTSAKFLDKTMKWSGFSFVDEFTKLIHLNAAAGKFERLSKSVKGVKEIERLYGEYFGADLPQLVQDLRAGKKSPLVGELVFRELSDVQPLSKLEMPKAWLENPNGRVFYTMKSFMVKQMNLVRERGLKEIGKGDPASIARGTAFLMRYSLALGMAGASISYIQDWIMGRNPSFDVTDVTENVFKSFGWGEFAVKDARKGKGLEAAANIAAPPFKMWQDIFALPGELEKWADDDPKANPRGAMYIPVVGKLIYNRMLGGAERHNARLEREERKRERAERGDK